MKKKIIISFLEYQEPIIRSNTPSNPEQKIHAEGRGAKLFRKRQGQGLFCIINLLHVYLQNNGIIEILRRAYGFLHQGWQW